MSIQTRPDVSPPRRSATATGKPTHPRRRAAAAVVAGVATVTTGAGLILLLAGVSNNAETDVPPSPGVTQIYEGEIPHEGLDRRLYNRAEELAAERRARMQLAPGADRRLYGMHAR